MYYLNKTSPKRQIAGILKQKYITLLGCSLPTSKIYIYSGAIKHIRRKHLNDFNKYFHLIPLIILNPDYIGENPTEPNSIEFVKRFADDVLVAVKLDPKGYLVVSSMYCISSTKVSNRIKSGRLISAN